MYVEESRTDFVSPTVGKIYPVNVISSSDSGSGMGQRQLDRASKDGDERIGLTLEVVRVKDDVDAVSIEAMLWSEVVDFIDLMEAADMSNETDQCTVLVR